MASVKKADFVFHLDLGICGTFDEWIDSSQEKNFRQLSYVPFGFLSKKEILRIPIHKDHITTVDYLNRDLKGVEPRVIFISSGRDDSEFVKVFASKYTEQITKLQDKVKNQEVEITALKQEVEDARSGVSKTLANIKSINKSQRDSDSSFGGNDNTSFGGGFREF